MRGGFPTKGRVQTGRSLSLSASLPAATMSEPVTELDDAGVVGGQNPQGRRRSLVAKARAGPAPEVDRLAPASSTDVNVRKSNSL